MCIRDRVEARAVSTRRKHIVDQVTEDQRGEQPDAGLDQDCLLYTSDAADERSSVDLGGRRIIKKKKTLIPHVAGYKTKQYQPATRT